MDTITLHTGRTMPVLGIGTWQLTDDTPGAIEHALSVGYRMIDTSGDYGTQPGIREGIERSDVAREDLYVVTKVEETEDAYESTKKQIGELGIERADLMLIHRPPEDGAGEELWRGLIRAKEEGLATDIGVSNYPQEKIDALIASTDEVPVVNQIEWSPFGHSEDMLSYAGEHDMIIQAYSPLTRTERLENDVLQEVAEQHDKTPAQVLIRWNIDRGTVPLPKANQYDHQKENIDVLDFELTAEEVNALNNLNERYSSLGELPYK